MQVEVLRRLRNGGQQFVRVEHVHVNDGGQAVSCPYRQRVLFERDALPSCGGRSSPASRHFRSSIWLLPDVPAVHFKEIEGA